MHLRATTKYQLLSWARIFGYAGVISLPVIGGIAVVLSLKILDSALIVNLWIAEAPVAFTLYYVLERKHAAVSHAVDLLDFASRYKHLELHTFRKFLLRMYVIENKTTSSAFLAPDYLTFLEEWLKVSRHHSEEVFDTDLNTRHVTNRFPQKASLDDLLPQRPILVP